MVAPVPRVVPPGRVRALWTGTSTCVAFWFVLLTVGACGEPEAERGPDGPGAQECLTDREFFEKEVWAPVLSKTCISCHQPGGQASTDDQPARFQLLPPTWPGFLDENLRHLREIARYDYEGRPLLLVKPLGLANHGGDAVLGEGDPAWQALEALVRRLADDEDPVCPTPDTDDPFPDVVLLTPHETWRKVALHAAGRAPSPGELERIAREGEAALDPMIRALIDEDGFHERLREMWNDLLLTDRYLAWRGASVGLLRREDFPARDTWYEGLSDADKDKVTRALAREPLELVSWVVRNDRPLTEILTADHTVVNPWSAPLLGADVAFDDPTSETEWRPARIRVAAESGAVAWPHAGLLTSPMVLNRFPTTPTNRNRARARMVLRTFLATDILRVAERPIDPTAATDYLNPTREDPRCNVCHKVLDPIAGAYQNFDDSDPERLRPGRSWHADMVPPGFGSEIMPAPAFENAAAWLAERVVADRRFPIAMVHLFHRAFTGRDPLIHPDAADPEFDARRFAWEAQDRHFQRLAEQFVAEDYNARVLVSGVLRSPWFRAKDLVATASVDPPELDGLGTARLLSPERLAARIRALVGVDWVRSWDQRSWLLTDYRLLYGGINSDTITERLTSPNGMMANVQWRMANEVACRAVSRDFTRDAAERVLLPHVALVDVPIAESGDEIPAAMARIRKNLQHLHAQLLDEHLADDSAELDASWDLFLETWKQGAANVRAGEEGEWLPWECRAEKVPGTDIDLPDDRKVRTDRNYTVRAWMAVVTYLLADYRFLHE